MPAFSFISKPRLVPAVAARLQAWQARPQPSLQQAHYQSRYVVLSLAQALEPAPVRPTAAGADAASSSVGIAALGLQRGRLLPGDAFYLQDAQPGAEQWLELLEFLDKDPLVSFQPAELSALLAPALARTLGLDFKPALWLGLENLLPELMRQRATLSAALPAPHVPPASLAAWLACFGLEVPAAAGGLAPALAAARLFQRLLAAAAARGIAHPAALQEHFRARHWWQGER